MKAIINGKCYDTEKAEQVAWEGERDSSDFNYWREWLHRTPKGAWFLHGEGGALSSYGRSCGRERFGGDAIVPMSDDEAYEWLERHRKNEAIEKFFADRVEEA